MSFRQSHNKTDRWARFLAPFSSSVQTLLSLQRSFATPSAFEELLQSGDDILNTLNEVEWMHLNLIVNRFADDWQSWFTRELYPAIHRQRDRRPWTPAESPLTVIDFSTEALFIHLWAPWNGYSRIFDETVRIVARRFSNRMAFRSFNVDSISLYDYFPESDRLQGPNHLYYYNGKRMYTGFGMPSVDELSSLIEQWLGNQPPR
ncbi:hypothetical protein SH449x_004652 [Pirellulaceae bacterium SH449]